MQVRAASWIIAAIFLLAFCWLGLAADKFASLFEGMEIPNPASTSLVFTYGLIACPILGATAAITLILSDKLRSGFGRLAQPTLTVIYALLAAAIFYSLLFTFSGAVSSIALKS